MPRILTNPWVGFADRDYLIIKQSIIDKKNEPLTGIPELTDDSEGNPFTKQISIWSGLTEQIGYYLDNRARNTYLLTTRRFADAVKIVRVWDYRIRGVIPSTGVVTFTSSIPAPSDITIPAGTVLETPESIIFETISEVVITTGLDTTDADVIQKVLVPSASIGTSDGTASQKFEIGTDVVDNSISVLINGADVFIPVDTFAFSFNDDKVFVAGLNEDRNMEIKFGDGINGEIPAISGDVTAEFFTSLGSGGDVANDLITTIVTTLTLPGGVTLTVANDDPTTGGTDPENLTDLQRILPVHIRTALAHGMITIEDHNELPALAPGVAKSGHSFDCGLTVDFFIAPTGGGIASPALLASTLVFLEDRKMILMVLQMFPAGELAIGYEINVTALATSQNSVVKTDVENILIEYHFIENQQVGGSIFFGDIYQIVEGTTGVDHSEIIAITPVPFARPLDISVPQLDWTRALKSASSQAKYIISFFTTTEFNLSRDGVFVGSFTVGVLVDITDLSFTILTSKTIGDRWEFITYAVNKSIELDEPSLPVTNIGLLTITVTGGL